MSYCCHCGTKNPDGAGFCTKCGQKMITADSSELSTVKVKAAPSLVEETFSVRDQNLQELNKMIQYFGKKQHFYEEYESLQSAIEEASTQTPEKWCKNLGGKILHKFVPVYISIAIAVGGFIGIIQGGTDGIIVGLLCIVGAVLLARHFLKKDYEDRSQSEVNYYYERLNTVGNELDKYYRAYGKCIVGYEFSNPKILRSIANMIRSGRADTVKEAINRLLEDNHRSYMEVQAEITARAARIAAMSDGIVAVAALCNPNIF